MLDNKLNHDFEKSRDAYGKKFTIKVTLSTMGIDAFDITEIVSDIKSIKYGLWNFATCELILNDKQKAVNRYYFFNSTNIIKVTISSADDDNELSFYGKIVDFKPVDFDNDIYYVKLFSQWGFLNIVPNKVKISIADNKTVSDILSSIIYYRVIPDKNNEEQTDRLFQLFSGGEGAGFFCSKTATDLRLNNFIVPNWNITEIMDYFTEMGITDDGYGFMWYEDRNGLYYISMKDFIEMFGNVKPTIFHFNKNQSIATYKKLTNANIDKVNEAADSVTHKNVIYDYEVLGFNIVELAKNNAGNQKRIIFNYATKEVSQQYELLFRDYFINHETINQSSLLGEDSMHGMGNRNPIEDREIDSQLYSSNGRNTNSITKSLFNNFQIKIKTNLFPEFVIGTNVYLEVPAIGGDEQYKYLEGRWIVIGIEHKYEVSSSYDNKPLATSILTLGRDSKEYSELDKLNKSITKTEKSITGV